MAGTLDQSNTNTANDGHLFHYNTSAYAYGFGFQPGVSGDLEQIIVPFCNWFAGYGAVNMSMKIFADNGSGQPNYSTQVGGTSGTVSTSGTTTWTTTTDYTIVWSTNKPSLTSGNKYWCIIDHDGGISASNGIIFCESTSATSANWTPYTRVRTQAGSDGGATTRYAVYKTYMTSSGGGGGPTGIMTTNRGWWGEQ